MLKTIMLTYRDSALTLQGICFAHPTTTALYWACKKENPRAHQLLSLMCLRITSLALCTLYWGCREAPSHGFLRGSPQCGQRGKFLATVKVVTSEDASTPGSATSLHPCPWARLRNCWFTQLRVFTMSGVCTHSWGAPHHEAASPSACHF